MIDEMKKKHKIANLSPAGAKMMDEFRKKLSMRVFDNIQRINFSSQLKNDVIYEESSQDEVQSEAAKHRVSQRMDDHQKKQM